MEWMHQDYFHFSFFFCSFSTLSVVFMGFIHRYYFCCVARQHTNEKYLRWSCAYCHVFMKAVVNSLAKSEFAYSSKNPFRRNHLYLF